jgi:cytochrome c oxidase subunit 1
MAGLCCGFFQLFLGYSTPAFLAQDFFYVIGSDRFQYSIALFFGVMAGIYYCFSRMEGTRLQRNLALLHFWGSFGGAFLLLQVFVYYPLPRRVIYYNIWTTFIQGRGYWRRGILYCAALVVLAQVVFLLNLIYSGFRGRKAE